MPTWKHALVTVLIVVAVMYAVRNYAPVSVKAALTG